MLIRTNAWRRHALCIRVRTLFRIESFNSCFDPNTEKSHLFKNAASLFCVGGHNIWYIGPRRLIGFDCLNLYPELLQFAEAPFFGSALVCRWCPAPLPYRALRQPFWHEPLYPWLDPSLAACSVRNDRMLKAVRTKNLHHGVYPEFYHKGAKIAT